MSLITVDAQLNEVMRDLKEPTEVRNQYGKVLGVFMPNLSAADEEEIYKKARSRVDPAEMKRRLREEGDKGSPLEEVWKRIHAREKK